MSGRNRWRALALVATGVALGVATEQALVGRRTEVEPTDAIPFPLLRGESVEVFAEDGVKLHVEVDELPAGVPADLTIVFVHGYGLNRDSWQFQRTDLRGVARMAFMDHRAHGRSHRGLPARTTIAQLGRDLRSVIQVVAPDMPIILVGHSMGGMTILSLAAQDPAFFRQRVRGVALMATTSTGLRDADLGLPPAVGSALVRAMPTALSMATQQQRLVEIARDRASDMIFTVTKRYAFGSDVPAALTQFVADMLNGTPVDVIAEYFAEVAGFEARAAVSQLDGIETLVMVGESDRVIPPVHSEEIVRHAPHAELVRLPTTGHMLMLERREEVDAHLRALIDRVRGSAPST